MALLVGLLFRWLFRKVAARATVGTNATSRLDPQLGPFLGVEP